jgi:HK97 family phage portal protein
MGISEYVAEGMAVAMGARPETTLVSIERAALMERTITIGPLIGSNHSSLEGLLLSLQGGARIGRAWTPAPLIDAIGIPAVTGAVNTISNVGGSLSLRAYRDGVELAPADRPRIVVRPNPFTTPRDFWRETFYAMAVWGEAFWWVASRDIDDQATALYPVPPEEVTVEENPRDLRYPVYKWRGRTMPREDFRQIVMQKRPGELRGAGPLQLCAGAISIAVAAQDWAANYFAGGNSETVIKSAVGIDDVEAATIKTKWADTPPNLPHVIGPTIEDVKGLGTNVAAAQMLEARDRQVVELATAFGMPAKMLNAAVSGSDITYQNVGDEWDELVRRCLLPNYLEPTEQAISDLLPRSTIARFNTDAYLRADVQTRANVFKTLVDAGMDPAQAASIVGFDADLENAPMPPSMPSATPSSLPFERSAPGGQLVELRREIRCSRGHLVGKVVGSGHELYCRHCKATVAA